MPNLVSGCDPIRGGVDAYFDVACFALPDPGHLGNVGRNSLTGPGYAAWDFAVFKNVSIKTVRVQWRVEGFNLTNRANFGLPATAVFNSSGPITGAGRITSIVGTARQFQFGVKLNF